MKKLLYVMVVLGFFSGLAFAEELKPVRIEVAFAIPTPQVIIEYVFPMEKMSFGVSAGANFSEKIGFDSGLVLYPFNTFGKGVFTNLGYSLTYEELSISETAYVSRLHLDAGYRWIFLKYLTARIQAGGEYFLPVLRFEGEMGWNIRVAVGAAL